MATSLSFVQYKHCSLCRSSCKKWRKHVHSPRHQEIVKNILAKFLKRISDVRNYIENPLIKDAGWVETERQVWCYSCTSDVDLHLRKTTMLGDCVVAGAGFLGHITRKDHSENTAKFLKDNLVDMKKTLEFVLDNDVFLSFLEKAEKASVDYLKEKNRILKRAASFIRQETAFHRHVMNQGLLEQKQRQLSSHTDSIPIPSQAEDTSHTRLKNLKGDQDDGERKKTDRAFGDGLTFVERSNEDDSEGNIHCNAVPPWLRKEESGEINKEGIIGPSILDWTKHKKLEQKRKLPTCRVGAKFDHQAKQGDEWLPNFGGLWSHGTRTKSSAHFKKRLNSLHPKRNEFQTASSNHPLKPVSSPSPSTSTSNDIRIPQNSFHHALPSDGFSRLHSHSSSNSVLDLPSTSSQSHTRSFNVFDGFVNNSNSGNDLPASLSQTSSRTIKPYVSKRRKVDQSQVSVSSTIPSFASQEPSYPKEHFSPHVSNYSHSLAPHFVGREGDRGISGYVNGHTTSTNSSIRLLHTPVLAKKK